MDIQRKTLSDPAFKKAFDELRMPERLRRMVAYTMWMSRAKVGRPRSMEEACFLARQWEAILERLQALGCLRVGVPGIHSVPWRAELKRCPWEDEHRHFTFQASTYPDKAVATAPVLGNSFEGGYSCCGRKYIDLVGLLDKDWDARHQEEASEDWLLASPLKAAQEAQR